MPFERIAISWPLNGVSGWGVYGQNLALQSLRRGIVPISVFPLDWAWLSPNDRDKLDELKTARAQLQALADGRPGQQISLDCPLLVDFGDQMVTTDPFINVRGSRNIGVAFFCDVPLSDAAVKTAGGLDWIIAGSNWNARVLRAHGLQKVSVVMQGIDPAIFQPGPRTIAGDRFVVYSGGKLEFRKGQDIVIAAMRVFQRRHPDAVLFGAWHNIWPATMIGIDCAGHVRGTPAALPDGGFDFTTWVREQGIQLFVPSPLLPNFEMARRMREVDVALFPSRCEGGTNLVAMECMACGIPTILSANTGHLDLIAGDICYPLRDQRNVPGLAEWGESSVQEIVELLEQIYANRAEARRRGAAGAEWIKKLSWENQIGLLLEEIGNVISSP